MGGRTRMAVILITAGFSVIPATGLPTREGGGEVPVAEAMAAVRAACQASRDRAEETGLVATWHGWYRMQHKANTMYEFRGRRSKAVNWRVGRSREWTTQPPKGSVYGVDDVKNAGPRRQIIAWPQGWLHWVPSAQRPAVLRRLERLRTHLGKPKLHWERDPWWYPAINRQRQKLLYRRYLRFDFYPPTEWEICRDPAPEVWSATRQISGVGTLWTLTVPSEVNPSHPARNPVTILVDPSGVIVEMLAPRYHEHEDDLAYAEARQPLRYTWEYRSQRIETPRRKRTVSTPVLLRACEQLGIDGCTHL